MATLTVNPLAGLVAPPAGWKAHTGLQEGIASTYQWLDRELAHGRRPRGFSENAEHAAQQARRPRGSVSDAIA
jgi:hypothetical protein